MNPSASLYIIRRLNDIHRVPKNVHLYIFQITLSKLTDFEVFLMWEILRKFDIKSLYIFPPYLYTVTTLPWEIQKVIFQQYYFNSIIYTDFRLLRYPRRNKLQLLYCSLSVYLLLFTASYYLLSPFYGQFFYLIGQSFSKSPMPTHNRLFSESPTFGGTQHYLQSDVKV